MKSLYMGWLPTIIWVLLLSGVAKAETAPKYYYTGDGEFSDFALDIQKRTAKLYLAKKPTNQPFTGLTPVFVPHEDGFEEVSFRETSEPGVYVAFVKDGPLPQGQLILEIGEDVDAVELESSAHLFADLKGHGGHDHAHGHEGHDHGNKETAKASDKGGADEHAGHDHAAHEGEEHHGHDHGHAHGRTPSRSGVELGFGPLVGLTCLFFGFGFFAGRGLKRPRPEAQGAGEARREQAGTLGQGEELVPVMGEAEVAEDQGKSKSLDIGAMILFGILSATFGETVIPDVALAGPGHSHGEVAIQGSTANGVVKISKKSQFLIGLTTEPATPKPIGQSLKTFGHVVPKPEFDAVIRAPQAGFFKSSSEVVLGSKVKKGEVIGRLEAMTTLGMKAPLSGTVYEVAAAGGSRVEPGDKLFRVVDTSKVWIDAEVFQRDLGRLEKARKVLVTLEGRMEQLEARVVGAQSIIDEQTLTAKVFLELDNAKGEIPLGALADVTFVMDEAETQGILLPQAGLLNRGGEYLVYVQTGPESFEPKPVAFRRGPRPQTVVITKGLEKGDRVVVKGGYQLLVGAN